MEFWEFIEWANWTGDYNAVRKRVMERFSFKEAQALREQGRSYTTALAEEITDYFSKKGAVTGGDSYEDLLWYVLSKGLSFYNKCKENPGFAYEVYCTESKESFAYCFPFEDDYKLLDKEVYLNRSARYIDNLNQAILACTEIQPESIRNQVITGLNRILEVMKMVNAGMITEASKFYDEIRATRRTLDESIPNRHSGILNGLHYGYENLLSDARDIYTR